MEKCGETHLTGCLFARARRWRHGASSSAEVGPASAPATAKSARLPLPLSTAAANLTAADAEDLVARSIKTYKSFHGHVPARVVVLKTSRFHTEEAEGVDAALTKAGIEMVDLLWVQESSPIAILRDGNYPVLRGTFVDLNGKGFLYTRGSVPYPGLRIPRPLLLVPHESTDRTILALAKDVLALTKINWSTTQFDQKIPAPIKAAREVGRILKHIDFGTDVSSDFRKYS